MQARPCLDSCMRSSTSSLALGKVCSQGKHPQGAGWWVLVWNPQLQAPVRQLPGRAVALQLPAGQGGRMPGERVQHARARQAGLGAALCSCPAGLLRQDGSSQEINATGLHKLCLACLMRSVSGGASQKCIRRTASRVASRQPRATRCAAARSL